MTTKIAAAALAAALLTTLTACGNATVPVAPADTNTSSSSAPAPAPGTAPASPTASATPGAGTSTSAASIACTVGTVQLQYCPPGFDLPSDVKVDVITQTPDETNLVVSDGSLKAKTDTLRAMLRAGGYTIETDAGGVIAFAGHGWVGNFIDSGVLAWWVEGRQAPSGSGSTEAWLTAADLGIAAAPFFLRYPAGTTISALVEKDGGSSYTLGGHTPAEFISWYTDFLRTVHVTVTRQERVGSDQTIEFSTDDFRSTLVCTPQTCTMTHVPV